LCFPGKDPPLVRYEERRRIHKDILNIQLPHFTEASLANRSVPWRCCDMPFLEKL